MNISNEYSLVNNIYLLESKITIHYESGNPFSEEKI